MKKITLILVFATFATKSFAHCPIPQWCPKADLHQTLCPGDTIETIEFPSVIAKILIVTWWTDETRIYSTLTPPQGITVSGTSTPTPLGEREYAWPVSIKGKPTAVGTHHYTVSNTCGVELLHGSITVNTTPPTIGTVIPTGERYTTIGTAFTPLTLTDDPIGSMPPITIQWYSNTTASTTGGIGMGTANGAQTNTFTPPANTVNTDGIYYYAVATDRCGSTAATNNTSGRHTIIHPIPTCPATTNPTPDNIFCTGNGATFEGIGTPFFKTNTVWTISAGGINQEWSDVVLTSTCGKTGFAGGADPNFNHDCRANRTTQTNEARPTSTNQGDNTVAYLGDLFSWCAVINHADVLCPDNWRVPTCQDFIELDIALGGNGDWHTNSTIRDKYIATSGVAKQFWGGDYVGYCNSTGPLNDQGSSTTYWSSSEVTTTYARCLSFGAGGVVLPQNSNNKNVGFALRCVR